MSGDSVTTRAPFPAFGGKSRVAHHVWARFGADAANGRDGGLGGVRNYVEPFCFSAAVLLARPGGPGPVETINDRNGFVCNFWRAVTADPDAVADACDWPVNEADLHARHVWLVNQAEGMTDRLMADPEWFDARVAAWWCWGACMWIGSGWCDEKRVHWRPRPELRGGKGSGISKRPGTTGDGFGAGVVRHRKVPRLEGHAGVTSARNTQGVDWASHRDGLFEWMHALASRLRHVRVCCGDWNRVCDSPTTMDRLGTTGVFLDPPYRTMLGNGNTNRTKHIYASDRTQDIDALCDSVQAWCLKWSGVPGVRIALCGMEGEYPEIEALVGEGASDWEKLAWSSGGGYGNQGSASAKNRHRERIWFSPGCLKVDRAAGLFETEGGGG